MCSHSYLCVTPILGDRCVDFGQWRGRYTTYSHRTTTAGVAVATMVADVAGTAGTVVLVMRVVMLMLVVGVVVIIVVAVVIVMRRASASPVATDAADAAAVRRMWIRGGPGRLHRRTLTDNGQPANETNTEF